MPYVDTFTSDNNPFQLSEQRKSASPASRRRTLLSPKRSSRGPSPAHSSSTPSSGVDHSSPLPSTSSSSSPSRNGAAVPQPVTNDLAGLSESTASLSFSDKPLSASTSSPLTTLSPLNTSLPPNTSEWGTLPDSTARLSFSDIHATSPFRFSGRPAQSKQSSAHSATIAGLEAELAELKLANTRLQAAIEASAGDSEQARVEHTQDAPSQAALRGPQRAEAIIRAEKKLERVERDFRALSASRREEAEQLRASISDKDATIADLRTALEDSNNKGQLILEQLQERELATAQREAQLQAQYEDMRTQHDDMTQQAKEFANKGQEVWDQLQQAQNKLHVAQATMEYERQVAKSSEQALKDVRQQLDATAKKAKEEQDKWKKEKEGLEDKLKVARGDTERIHKDREVWRTLCNDKEADIKQLEEKLKVKSGDRQADALVASKDAIVAQKNMRPLRALCHWASVDAFLEGVEDIKNLTSKSLYNRTSLLLDLSWKIVNSERLTLAQTCCTSLLRKQPDYYKAHRLQGRVYLEQKNHSEAITSFNTAIRLALETEDSEEFVRATEKQLKEARRLAEQQQEEEAKQRDQKLQQEYDEWIRGKWKDSQILNLEKTSGGMAYTRAQISNAAKTLASKYHPDKPGGNTKIMQRIFEARDRLLKRAI